jgi:hypothetical protein
MEASLSPRFVAHHNYHLSPAFGMCAQFESKKEEMKWELYNKLELAFQEAAITNAQLKVWSLPPHSLPL